jgi:predicted phosphodiesterase
MSLSRIAVLADAHANYSALEAVLLHASKNRVDEIWYLGDVVGYGPEPQLCLKLLIENVNHKAWILGNHDVAMHNFFINNESIVDKITEKQQLLRKFLDPLTSQIGNSNDIHLSIQRNYEILEMFPEKLQFLLSRNIKAKIKNNFILVHGGLRHGKFTTTYTRNLWDVRDEFSVIKNRFKNFTPSICLVGHTHKPTCFKGEITSNQNVFTILNLEQRIKINIDENFWLINPGSVGQPRDGDNRASYIIIDLNDNYIQFYRIEYNFKMTQKRMRELEMPKNFIKRLSVGK